jgi:hypothetical protein
MPAFFLSLSRKILCAPAQFFFSEFLQYAGFCPGEFEERGNIAIC